MAGQQGHRPPGDVDHLFAEGCSLGFGVHRNNHVPNPLERVGPGFGMPSKPPPRPDLSGGWGLPIVETISNRWGVERNNHSCV